MGAYMYIEGLSVVIPARNEAVSLEYVLRMIAEFCDSIYEVVVIVDSKDDSTLSVAEISSKFDFRVSFLVNQAGGIANAIKIGVGSAESDYILIAMADEMIPVITFDEFYSKLLNGADIVSATRYGRGGRRYGGNFFGKQFSRSANKIMSVVFRDTFSDFTTGMKAIRKSNSKVLLTNIDYGGWAPALRISINAIRNKLIMDEVSIISVDRILDGSSSFSLGPWIIQYLKAFFAK
jgi:glycosyltransferase involved in cell wall biosynthesis